MPCYTCKKCRSLCRLWPTEAIVLLAFCWLLEVSKVPCSDGRTQDVQGDTTLSFALPRPVGIDTLLLYVWLANSNTVGLLDFKQAKKVSLQMIRLSCSILRAFLSQAFTVPINCHGHNFCIHPIKQKLIDFRFAVLLFRKHVNIVME